MKPLFDRIREAFSRAWDDCVSREKVEALKEIFRGN